MNPIQTARPIILPRPSDWSPSLVEGSVLVEHEIEGRVHVEVEWLGEGFCGDYDPNDPHDVPLVRFVAGDLTGRRRDAQDTSYCTLIPAYAPRVALRLFAQRLAQHLAPLPEWSRPCEAWSAATVDEKGRLVQPAELTKRGRA